MTTTNKALTPARRLVALVLFAALLAAATTALVASPAEAAGKKYRLTTKAKSSSGKASAAGTLTFLKNRKRVHVRGTVKDLCNGDKSGDGYSAVVAFELVYAGGGRSADTRFADTNGCRRPAKKYQVVLAGSRKLAKVRVTVCKIDYSENKVGDCVRRAIDNPRVG